MSSRSSHETVQADLDELQRKHRLMEATRRAYTEESSRTVRVQREQISRLKVDNSRLKDDLALETRQAKEASALAVTAQIASLQEQCDIYTRRAEKENTRISALRADIERVRAEIDTERRSNGDLSATANGTNNVQRQIRILENRLDKALVKFNEAVAANKRLKDRIGHLRREKTVFDAIYTRVESELRDKQREMGQIVELINAAFAARDEAQSQMLVLKSEAEREQKRFDERFERLGQRMEANRLQMDALTGKDLSPLQTKRLDELGGFVPANEQIRLRLQHSREETELKHEIKDNDAQISSEKKVVKQVLKEVDEFEKSFELVKSVTGVADLNQLVQEFANAEEENFSLFNYVNDLSGATEHLETSISQIRGEIQKYQDGAQEDEAAAEQKKQKQKQKQRADVDRQHGDGGTQSGADDDQDDAFVQHKNVDEHRKKILKDLEETLRSTKARTAIFNSKIEHANETLGNLKGCVQRIFDRLMIEPDDSSATVLGNTSVTENNMMEFLGLIEQKVSCLLGENDAGLEPFSITNTLLGETAVTVADKTKEYEEDEGGDHGYNDAGDDHNTADGNAEMALYGGITITPPTTVDFYEDKDDLSDPDANGVEVDDARPFSRKELETKTLRSLARNDESSSKTSSPRRPRMPAEASASHKSSPASSRRVHKFSAAPPPSASHK